MRLRTTIATGMAGACIAAASLTSCADSGDTGTCADDWSCSGKGGSGGSGGTGGSSGTGGSGATAGDAGSAGDAGEDSSTGGTGGTAGAGGHDAGDAEAGGSGGDDGGDAEAEPYCDPASLPDEDPCVIHDDHGVFVSPTGSDGAGCGTMASPCATVARGLTEAKAAGKRLYACGDASAYDENLTIDSSLDGLSVFGGFRCGDWSYAPGSVRTQVKPTGAQTPLLVDAVTSLEVRGFAFESGDATSAGQSSIAAIVRGSSGVVFMNSTFTAGDAAPGNDGSDGAAGEAVPSVGADQKGDDSTCGSTTPNGGGAWLTAFQCAAGGSTRGGKGGTAEFEVDGYPGQAGTEATNVQAAGMGQGGPGGTAGSKAGKAGGPGSAGNPGNNGTAATAGVLSASGYTPAHGTDGTHGWPGQGGGGSGASWSNTGCVGPSGGAGGLGGCGGFSGTKGTGGGASIGLLVWDSAVTLQDCAVTSGAGGKGGDAGAGGAASLGQLGATGGASVHLGMEDAGKGGTGGNGGPGGSGSGGTGGPSYAIAHKGTAPVQAGTVTLTPGSAGGKGVGGQAAGGTKAPDGLEGPSAQVAQVP
jgi:hypothetical protein